MVFIIRDESNPTEKGEIPEIVARMRQKYVLREVPHLWGYRAAAQVLVEYLADPSQKSPSGLHPFARDADYLAFPLLHLYAHHLELYLKCLLRDALGFSGKAREWRMGHSLLEVWTELRDLLVADCAARERYKGFDDEARLCAELLGELDEYGHGWRYPFDPKGKPYLPEDLLSISVSDLVKRFESVAQFLGYWEETFDNFREQALNSHPSSDPSA